MNVARTLVFVAACASGLCSAEEARRNPFLRPVILAPGPESTRGAVETDPLSVAAILSAGDDSLVTVDGVIVGIGDAVSGYVLRSVLEEKAVFVRGDDVVTVSIFDVDEADEN